MDSIQKNVGVDRDEESNRIRNMSLNDPPHDDEKNNSFGGKQVLEQKPVAARAIPCTYSPLNPEWFKVLEEKYKDYAFATCLSRQETVGAETSSSWW
uniref:Uncharacterized protein n=1 Tax=Tanacetum cinerariifolium TaxID=118510 RepID=A0A699HI56_TANCI|nr:hypothetical protein [Tanacetum cinerariifolium]